jgi:hypothetical protein
MKRGARSRLLRGSRVLREDRPALDVHRAMNRAHVIRPSGRTLDCRAVAINYLIRTRAYLSGFVHAVGTGAFDPKALSAAWEHDRSRGHARCKGENQRTYDISHLPLLGRTCRLSAHAGRCAADCRGPQSGSHLDSGYRGLSERAEEHDASRQAMDADGCRCCHDVQPALRR